MLVRITVVLAVLAATAGLALASPDAGSACARGYSPCLPVKADLDCGQIPDSKKPVRVTGADPYGLDADRDGLGCEVSGEGGGRQSPWGLILRKPPRKEATSVKVGDIVTVVGWSPRAFKGQSWSFCVGPTVGSACNATIGTLGPALEGPVQTFARVRVQRDLVFNGVFKLTLMVKGKGRASDSVPVR